MAAHALSAYDSLVELALPRLPGEDETGLTDDVCELLLSRAGNLQCLDLCWNSLLTASALSCVARCCAGLQQLAVAGLPIFSPPASLPSTAPSRDVSDAACSTLLALCVDQLTETLRANAERSAAVGPWLLWLSSLCTVRPRAPDVMRR